MVAPAESGIAVHRPRPVERGTEPPVKLGPGCPQAPGRRQGRRQQNGERKGRPLGHWAADGFFGHAAAQDVAEWRIWPGVLPEQQARVRIHEEPAVYRELLAD